MSDRVSVRINNPHGFVLLKELEAVGVISIEELSNQPQKVFNGKRFRGNIPLEDKDKFRQHIENIRNEWERDI